MGHLPIPADMYFQDFAFDVLEYRVSDGGSVVGTYRGLSNTDETGDYIGFSVKDQESTQLYGPKFAQILSGNSRENQ